jgi:hypothetical protein
MLMWQLNKVLIAPKVTTMAMTLGVMHVMN